MSDRRQAPPVPRLMAITDRKSCALGDWLALLDTDATTSDTPVDAVQLREKDLCDRQLIEATIRLRQAFRRQPPASGTHAVSLLINGRVDLALACGADGVHLPSRGVPVTAVRRFLDQRGAGLLIGLSTHRPDEVAQARDDGADYVTFGPIFPTPSKQGFGEPPGLDGLRAAVGHGLPVLALGGVGATELTAVADTGAWGAAGIRAFQSRRCLVEMTRRRRQLWPSADA